MKKQKNVKCASLACRVSSASREHKRARPYQKDSEDKHRQTLHFSPVDATTHLNASPAASSMPPLFDSSACIRSTDNNKSSNSRAIAPTNDRITRLPCLIWYYSIVKESDNPNANSTLTQLSKNNGCRDKIWHWTDLHILRTAAAWYIGQDHTAAVRGHTSYNPDPNHITI